MERKVYFVGAGPGNPKLITVLGREMLEKADLVMYAGSLVNPEVLNYTKGETVDSYGLTLDETTKIIADAVDAGKFVVRLHSGDPSLYGSVIEQMEELRKYDIEVERVAGVSSVFASAAALGTQLTLNGVSDTLIITRPAGKTWKKTLSPSFLLIIPQWQSSLAPRRSGKLWRKSAARKILLSRLFSMHPGKMKKSSPGLLKTLQTKSKMPEFNALQ
jgi:precorrin-4 methylase